MSLPYRITWHPSAPFDERYEMTVKLDFAFLEALQHPMTPLYHGSPAATFRVERNPFLPQPSTRYAYVSFVSHRAVGSGGRDATPIAGSSIVPFDVRIGSFCRS